MGPPVRAWVMNGNRPLLSPLCIHVFPTTLDDISLISHVLHISGKLLHQTLQAPVCQRKRESGCLPDGWVTRTEQTAPGQMWEEKKSQGLLWAWIPRGGAVSVNLGLIHVRMGVWCLLKGPAEGDKFKWKWSKLHKWTDIAPVSGTYLSVKTLLWLEKLEGFKMNS